MSPPVVPLNPPRSGRQTISYVDLMKPDEDWRTLPNSLERRRIQNRLAQRAYRRNMRARTKELEKVKKELAILQNSAIPRRSQQGHRQQPSQNASPTVVYVSSQGNVSPQLGSSPMASTSPSPPRQMKPSTHYITATTAPCTAATYSALTATSPLSTCLLPVSSSISVWPTHPLSYPMRQLASVDTKSTLSGLTPASTSMGPFSSASALDYLRILDSPSMVPAQQDNLWSDVPTYGK